MPGKTSVGLTVAGSRVKPIPNSVEPIVPGDRPVRSCFAGTLVLAQWAEARYLGLGTSLVASRKPLGTESHRSECLVKTRNDPTLRVRFQVRMHR